MFNQVVENFRQAGEATVQLQQEIFKKWLTLWPGMTVASPTWVEQAQQFQKKWIENLGDLLKRQRELTENQFKAGQQNIEKAFQLAQAKSPEELRSKTLELWQQCFDNLRLVYEAQLRGLETATEKWSGFAFKAAS